MKKNLLKSFTPLLACLLVVAFSQVAGAYTGQGGNCAMCHGLAGEGNGQIAALLANKPANLTLDVSQNKSDGALFLTLTNGVADRMPSMVENLTVRDRWDVVNYIRTLNKAQ